MCFSCFQNKDGQFFVPFDSELECRQNVVVYDSNTSSTREMSELLRTIPFLKYLLNLVKACEFSY